MNHSLISILLCTYNGADYLEEQIQSILHQTYPNIEIIISDDASTDETRTILKKYINNSNIIICLNDENIGLQKNIAQALGLSKGHFIGFSDQDDYWLPEKVEKLYKAIGNYSLVYGDSKLVDEKGNYLNKNLSDFRNLQDISNSKGFGIYNAVSGHTMLATREVVERALPFPSIYYHDWWIAVQASNLNGVKFLDESLTLYRQHDKNTTENIIQKVTGSRPFSKRYHQFMKDLKWLEQFKNNKFEKEKLFYTQFYNLYRLKNKGHFVWPLFWFLIRNQVHIFKFSPKNKLSQLVEIRKRSRGEKEM